MMMPASIISTSLILSALYHYIRVEHNIVIMVFSTVWMLLNHACAFNSGDTVVFRFNLYTTRQGV